VGAVLAAPCVLLSEEFLAHVLSFSRAFYVESFFGAVDAGDFFAVAHNLAIFTFHLFTSNNFIGYPIYIISN